MREQITVGSLEADHRLLTMAARDAGALALDYFRNGVKSWDKGPDDPVSEADLAVDRLLQNRLMTARPGYGWLSEESENDPQRLARTRTWIVDPIDGTRAFLDGKAEFTICVALVECGRPISAAVYNPATDEFFEATAGGGARLNGAAIEVKQDSDLAASRILSTWKLNRTLGEWMSGDARPEHSYVNSIAYRVALVATGQYDAAVSIHDLNDWDLAAADLIVSEAGGCATNWSGAPYVYNRPTTRQHGMVVSNRPLHASLLEFAKYAKTS